MTKEESIIREAFKSQTPASCKAKGLCYGAIDPRHNGCIKCSTSSSWLRASGVASVKRTNKYGADGGWSNMSASDTEANCVGVDSMNGYDMCVDASVGCGGDSACNELAIKYAQALKGGYTKDFTAFKNKARNLGLFNQGLDFLSDLLNRGDNNTSNNQYGGNYGTPPKSGMSTGAKIGIGIGAVALIGTIIYFATKK